MCRKDNDRLSSLSNDVLVNILSWLPTKSAVTTSVLSRSWRYLWTQITTLRFTTCDLSKHLYNRRLFVFLMNITRQNINLLELIVVNSTTSSMCNIDELVVDMLFCVPYVKELRVKIEDGGASIYEPRLIFRERSLEAIEMDGVMMITNLWHNHSLPELRKLVINVRNCDLLNFENVLSSCPSLEFLRLGVNAIEKLTHRIEIKSRNLKWLCLNLIGTYDEVFSKGEKEVMIDAPKLEYLEVNSPVMLRLCFLEAMCGLSRAKLSVGSVNPEQISMLLNPISEVKTLSLCSDDIMFALNFTDKNNEVETFNRLTRVEIKFGGHDDLDWLSIGGARKFLKACPNLKSLVLRRKHGSLSWVKFMFFFMFETPADFESTSDLSRRFDDMKLIGDFDRVKKKDGKIMVEITVHVYQNDDQLIDYAKGFVLPNLLWPD